MSEDKCEKPDRLKGEPSECSPAQVEECHGEVKAHPCTTDQACLKPEKLENTPEDCSPEQISECHGGEKKHPCTTNPTVSH